MTINHHASDALLLAYAAGRLTPAPALVVASHVAMSGEDASRLSIFEQLGGALLDEQPMADMTPDLFEQMLARLDEPAPAGGTEAALDHVALDLGVDLPAPLASREIGKWRTISPGIRFADVAMPDDPEFKVVLLRVAASRSLPQHGHSGNEYTLVLKGYFSDDSGLYGPGDLQEEDSESNHRPTVTADGECICLTAIQGRLLPDSAITKMILPLFGF